LARDFGTTRFGYEGYAIEELVAELGAALLCADPDLTLEPREGHAAYIANWLVVLKADNARSSRQPATHSEQQTSSGPAARGLHRPVASGAHRIRPIDILYVVRRFSYRISAGGWHYAKN